MNLRVQIVVDYRLQLLITFAYFVSHQLNPDEAKCKDNMLVCVIPQDYLGIFQDLGIPIGVLSLVLFLRLGFNHYNLNENLTVIDRFDDKV